MGKFAVMLKRVEPGQLNDFFLPLSGRREKGVYFCRIAGYSPEIEAFVKQYYEAARVDGAGAWQCFWRVTLPGLLPTLFMTAVLSLLNTFKVFVSVS